MPSAMSSERLRGILDIGRLADAQTDLGGLIDLVTRQTCSLLEAERGSLYVLDREAGDLHTTMAMGLPGKAIRLKLHQGVAGLVAAAGESIVVDDAYAHPRFYRGVDEATGYRTRTILCVPIKSRRGDVLGVLELLNKRTGNFTPEDEETLLLLAPQLGVALANARLYDGLRTGVDRLSRLMKVGAAISSELDLDALLRTISQTTSHLLGAERSTVFEELIMALTHLVDNATKFTLAGGRVTVRARPVAAEDGSMLVEIAVQDTGIGIPAELHAKVFERFYQVDSSTTRQFGGVGIGLAAVKQIVEAHGSRVLVEREPGKGSTFRFHLPVAT